MGSKNFDKKISSAVNKIVFSNNVNIDDINFTSPKEVKYYIKNLKNRKAPGMDAIIGFLF